MSALLDTVLMSDTVQGFRDLKEYRKMRRDRFGVPCPKCIEEQPKRQPTILEPGRVCRVHKPHYRDPRPEPEQKDIDTL